MSSTGRNLSAESGRAHRAGENLTAAVDAALTAAGIAAGSTILVGVSGGPDSTALLAALVALRGARRLHLHACIVDHGIRERAQVEADVSFARELCVFLRVPLHVASVADGECARRARTAKRSLEEVGREVRLRELAVRAEELGASAVALGHTQDDCIETILMRVLQGSDAAGLRGIPLRRGPFVRPLLACSRSDVLAYLELRKLGHRTDLTNSDPAMLRNRIRGLLVPLLAERFPGYRTGLLALARKSSDVADMLRESAGAMPWKRTASGFSIPADMFFSHPAAVRSFSLLSLSDALRGRASRRRLPYRFLLPALGQAPLSSGAATILRGHGVRLHIRGGSLFWEADIVRGRKNGYLIVANGTGASDIRIRSAGVIVRITREKTGGKGFRPPDVDASILEREIVPPIILRSRRKGDRVVLEQGTKTLKVLFAEWKVPEGDRWKVPILADRSGVLAVLGRALGYRTLARKGAAAPRRGDAVLEVRTRKDREGTSEQQF
jgi:tRNA(Ile)-lysidine synthetase-like protein